MGVKSKIGGVQRSKRDVKSAKSGVLSAKRLLKGAWLLGFYKVVKTLNEKYS